jgi:Protein of unknown function (DUF1569)
MKSIFDTDVAMDFAKRIHCLTAENKPLWGKMNGFQMLKHCSEIIKSSFGERADKRPFISYIIGKMLLKKIIKDDKPSSKNSPTHPAFVIKETGDFEEQKRILLFLVDQYPNKDKRSFEGREHPFFGKMKAEEYGLLDYKHLDHHLRQFGV